MHPDHIHTHTRVEIKVLVAAAAASREEGCRHQLDVLVSHLC